MRAAEYAASPKSIARTMVIAPYLWLSVFYFDSAVVEGIFVYIINSSRNCVRKIIEAGKKIVTSL